MTLMVARKWKSAHLTHYEYLLAMIGSVQNSLKSYYVKCALSISRENETFLKGVDATEIKQKDFPL